MTGLSVPALLAAHYVAVQLLPGPALSSRVLQKCYLAALVVQ